MGKQKRKVVQKKDYEGGKDSSSIDNDSDNDNNDDNDIDHDNDSDNDYDLNDDDDYDHNHDHDSGTSSSFLESVAIFGDSPMALIASFLMLLFACALYNINIDNTGFTLPSSSSSSSSFNFPHFNQIVSRPFFSRRRARPKIFQYDPLLPSPTPQMIRSFKTDGAIALRGLIPKDMLSRLDQSSHFLLQQKQRKLKKYGRTTNKGTQFFMVHVGAAFQNATTNANTNINTNTNTNTDTTQSSGSPFREVALSSLVPQFAAALLGLSSTKGHTMRMLRDIFLVKDTDQYICGWHVDDTGFWPATAEAPGVNAWIAIDDMPIDRGGGFALALGSHTAPWKAEAHTVTGSTLTLPEQGFRDAADMFANRTGSGTCNIQTSAPHLHAKMEHSKYVYDIKRGDVIFHDRWLFHRTVPFQKQRQQQQQQQQQDLFYRRYSVRYGPGSSRIPPGYGLELSVLWNKENGGRTADEVAQKDGPWYPKCFPTTSQEELKQLAILESEKIPRAEELRKLRQKEMKPYLEALRK